jgi:hypothetical protein
MGFERIKPRNSERPPPDALAPPLDASVRLIGGRYRIESRLAEGGMGCVYRVHDERTGAQLALKRLLRGESRQHVALFEREYRTLVGIQHPRIIRAFDYGVDAEGPYYTMELAPGRDLHKLAPLPVQTALSYLRDIATCLGLLHTRRLLHRDITPHNVRVLDNGECKLIDFGALTSFGIPELVVGTPPCIPPEALKRAPIDQRADIFSFGAMMYWSLTRRHAFPARTISELTPLWRKRPVPPSSLVPGISKQLDAFVLRLLQIDPQLRPATMAEVVERLTVLGELPPEDAATQHALAESYLVHTSCVGREPELRRLREISSQLRTGRGHAALLLGPRGVGRSRMLHEVSLQGQLLGLPILQLDARARPEPYGSMITLLEYLIDQAPSARQLALTHATTLAQLDTGIARRLGIAAAAPHAEISGDWRARVQQLSLDLVNTACLAHPLMLLVDDVDAADEASLAMFAGLAGLTSQTQLTLIATATDAAVQARLALSWRSLYKRTEKIELSPLSSRDVATLARSLFGDVPNLQRFSEWLSEHGGGLPLHIMALIRRLYASALIRYVDGIWVLPVERPPQLALDDLDQLLAGRVEHLSENARALAEAIAIAQGTLTREQCAQLVTNANPLMLLDELVRAEVLEDSLQGYRFTHQVLRDLLRARMSAARREQLHVELAERTLSGATPATLMRARMEAGWHLLQAGHEERGADLLATVAYDAVGVRLAFADLQVIAPTLETALKVYTKLGRPLHARMPLMTALAQAGYYVDRMWGERYGDDALAAAEELSGLKLAARLRPYLGRTLGLLVGLTTGWLRFMRVPRRQRSYTFLDVMTQLFGVVTTLTGAAAIALDVPRAAHVAAALEPFMGLPKRVTPTGIAEYCASLKEIGRENQAGALAVWYTLLARFEDRRRYYVALPQAVRPLYTGGLLFARGVFESFRDGQGALECADGLDRLGLKLYAMIASALRSIHFANRGDLIQARLHREQVEVHAIQVGSAWQVELWEPAALILVYTQIGDVTEMIRIADRLDALATHYPSLALHAKLARLALGVVREDDGGLQIEADAPTATMQGVLQRVLEVIDEEPPRSFIGWGAVCGFAARALNYVGRHAEAKALCERALSQLTEADRPFVTLFLNIEIELAAADAGLGRSAEAHARMEEIRSFHGESDNPLTRGRIHEAFARLSARSGDWPAYREHLDAMRSWYGRTGTATLIARVERLRALDPVQSNRPDASGTKPANDQLDEVDPDTQAAQLTNENAAATVCTVTDITNTDSKAPGGIRS